MIGTNRMQLNEATMMDVVQQWLDRQLAENAPKVTGITSYNGVFEVTLQGTDQ
jgi:hypothetical protein